MAKFGKGDKLICEVCSNTFKYIGNTSGRFCSRECYKESCRQGRLQKCENCGKDFDAGYEKRICCSKKCMGEYRYKKKIKQCEECGSDMHQRGKNTKYCSRECYSNARRGKPRKEKTKRKIKKSNGRFLPNGSKRTDAHGYIMIKIGDNDWMKEHRHVVEMDIGRKLETSEQVHHRNGIKNDNRIENLELWTTDYSYSKNSHPYGIRVTDYIKHYIETLPKSDKKEVVDYIIKEYSNESDELLNE